MRESSDFFYKSKKIMRESSDFFYKSKKNLKIQLPNKNDYEKDA